jgi:hypothetical protein
MPKVKCFQVTIFLSTDNPRAGRRYEIGAGDNETQVLSGQYHADMAITEKEVYMEILYKLAEAVGRADKSISIVVDGSNNIVRDTSYSFPVHPLESAITSAIVGHEDPYRAAIGLIRSVISNLAEDRKSGEDPKPKRATGGTRHKPKGSAGTRGGRSKPDKRSPISH